MKPPENNFAQGTYGYDISFFAKNGISTAELKDSVTGASVLLVPGFQGRVMTSSADGVQGRSFGWINYQLIGSGKTRKQFNPFGGEERLWLGPEGGPFSIYFPQGKEQVFDNWLVPAPLDTEPFDVVSQTTSDITFRKEFHLTNASGTIMGIGIERKVKLLSRSETEETLGKLAGSSLHYVAYESENILINKGTSAWNKKSGFLSLWLLSMFNPSEKGVVFVPVRQGSETDLGKVVTDDYFGKIPSERLVFRNGFLFFKVDGKFRSKLGISPSRALPYVGSYDPENKVLTLLWFSKPETVEKYVNSKWGRQDNPLGGDVVNSYNDGPVSDGSIMGPFYEIETSSPAALLEPGQKMVHRQRIFHITGSQGQLEEITQKLFHLSLQDVVKAFNN